MKTPRERVAARKDAEIAWFDPVLFYVNGELIWDGKKQSFGTYHVRYLLPSMPGKWATISRGNPIALRDTKAIRPIKRILSSLARYRHITPTAWNTLRDLAGEVSLVGTEALGTKPGSFAITGTATVDRDIQWLARLVAELVFKGLDDRIRICKLPTCDNFFIARKTKGPEQRYCTTSHASQHRVQRKRERDRA